MSLSVGLENGAIQGPLSFNNEVDRKIEQVANQPGEFAYQIREWRFLQSLSNPVLGYLQEATGVPFWLVDKMEAFRRYSHGETDFISQSPVMSQTSCSYSATALLSQEIFDQKYIKTITAFPQFIEELQDDQPGVFRVISNYFDHVIVLIKTIENGMAKYRIVQSFLGVYSLKEFIETSGKEFFYEDYQDLSERFLRPLVQVISTDNPIGVKELSLWAKLSNIADVNIWVNWTKSHNTFGRVIPLEFRDLKLTRTTDTKQEVFRDRSTGYLESFFEHKLMKTLEFATTSLSILGVGALVVNMVGNL